MKTLIRLALAATLVALLAPSAALAVTGATAFRHSRVNVRLTDTGNGVYAITTVESTYGLPVTGELTLISNGQTIKVEPVATDTAQMFTTWVSGPGSTVSICAGFDGRALGNGDFFQLTSDVDCDYRANGFRGGLTPAPSAGSRDLASTPVRMGPRLAR